MAQILREENAVAAIADRLMSRAGLRRAVGGW